MRIEIAERLRPFSHEPGTQFILPGSCLRLKIYPEVVFIEDISESTPRPNGTIQLKIKGPLKDFTIQQDLEKGCIRVWGKGGQSFVRYELHALEEKRELLCFCEKGISKDSIVVTGNHKISFLKPLIGVYQVPVIDRLSLGNHKKQDFALICRRKSMEEIFPLWHRLGQLIPVLDQHSISEESSLFDHCRSVINSSSPENILSSFMDLFLSGFEHGLSPRISEKDYQGIFSGPIHTFSSPLYLLTEGAKLIRSLFVQEKKEKIHLLPGLPPQFHCGRLLGVCCENGGVLDMEWTKKNLRRVVFHAKEEKEVSFTFCKDQKECRLRHSYTDRGEKYIAGSPLKIITGKNYWFDNFQK